MRTPIDWLPFVLQTSDPLFPTGAYAHSLGFEEWARLAGVRGEEDFRAFLELQILPALTNQELPYLRFVHAAASRGDLDELIALDHEIHAWKIPSELRAASLSLGGRRLEILLKIAPTSLLSEIHKRKSGHEMIGHHLTISGVQYSGVPLDVALMTCAYQALSSYCVAALKLIRLGQEGCQRVLSACLPKVAPAIRESLEITRDRAGWFNPLLEIAGMRHESAFERMFIS